MDKFEVLKEYKGLLDSGAITAEEYEQKKKEILGTPDDVASTTINSPNELSFDVTTEDPGGPIELNLEEPAQEKKSGFFQSSAAKANVRVNTKAKTAGKKKPIYKKWWFWLIIAVLIFGGLGSSGKSDETAPEESAIEQTQEAEPQEDTATEQTQETEPQEDKATTESQSNKVEVSDDFIVDYLNASDTWSGKWKVGDEGFFVFYPEGDLAEAFNMLVRSYVSSGKIPSELEESYNSMLDGMCSLSSGVEDAAGRPCALSVVNPSNTDNVLLTFMSGKVVYNAFEE